MQKGLDGLALWLSDDPGLFMIYWDGSLYVVIEAWQEKNFHDERIDALPEDKKKVTLLKRCRNGAFHFQDAYLNEKMFDFLREPSTANWVRQVNEAFGGYFLGLFGNKNLSIFGTSN